MHLYGLDSYRRTRAVKTILAQYQKKYPEGTVQQFDCTDADTAERFRVFAGATGLFAKVSLAVLVNAEEADKEVVSVLKSLGSDPTSTAIVVSDKKLPRAFSFLYDKEVGPAQKEYAPLEGAAFLRFLKADAHERGLTVSDAHISTIGALYSGNTWGAVTEIERVASGGEITAASTQFDFIGLIRTIASEGPLARRLRALLLLLEYDEPAKVFNMVAAFASGSAKVQLADYDIAIKSGKFEYAEALLQYILQVA